MRYADLYAQGKTALERAEIAEAALDARLLLEFVCQTDRTTLFAHPEKEVSAQEQKRFEEMITKRAEHIPLQHLTGQQDFMGLEFLVNEHVLIPRQDTEILVEEVMRDLHDGVHILDMCTGSGCILLSLLHYSNDTTGIGVDLSQEALKVAKANAEKLGLAGDVERMGNSAANMDAFADQPRARFVQSDLFEAIDEQFDIIVSNPPYIRTDVIETLMPEVRDHDPRMALDGTADGLYFYRKIIEESEKYLKRGGQLFFEIGHDQAEDVVTLMQRHGYKEIEVKKDYAGLDRVVYGTFLGGK
ncbi:MAG: peptide chain release factor N(5)-glutamine methyltransferase [Lachnospiraceae bacterium]|nr:peptide chain release factor N(5)-glutamine methyltransferase [Lachnospiraceae bacterium]